MANIVTNEIRVHGHDLARERAAAEAAGTVWEFRRSQGALEMLLPRFLSPLSFDRLHPLELPTGVSVCDNEHARRELYRRRIQMVETSWGCASNIDEGDIVSRMYEDYYMVAFGTRSKPPTKVMQEWSRRVPDVIIEHRVEEFGGGLFYRDLYLNGERLVRVTGKVPVGEEEPQPFGDEEIEGILNRALPQPVVHPCFQALAEDDADEVLLFQPTEVRSCGWSSEEYAAWQLRPKALEQLLRDDRPRDHERLLELVFAGLQHHEECDELGARMAQVVLKDLARCEKLLSASFVLSNAPTIAKIGEGVALDVLKASRIAGDDEASFCLLTAFMTRGDAGTLRLARLAGIDINQRAPTGECVAVLDVSDAGRRAHDIASWIAAGGEVSNVDGKGSTIMDALLRQLRVDVVAELIKSGHPPLFTIPFRLADGSIIRQIEDHPRDVGSAQDWAIICAALLEQRMAMERPAGRSGTQPTPVGL